ASDESNTKYSNIFWAFYCISSSAEGGANKPPSRGRGTTKRCKESLSPHLEQPDKSEFETTKALV
ncbi:MAG: hypothetical protein IJY04_10440, partial [Clostridia bacterium]|nr:hypothetical protein [Clostridia bacterium]